MSRALQWSLRGGRAAEKSGDDHKTIAYYQNLIENVNGATTDRQELTIARSYLEKHQVARF